MKRILVFALVLTMAFGMVACGNTASSSSSSSESSSQAEVVAKDYAQILKESRTDEENEVLSIGFPKEDGTGFDAILGHSDSFEDKQMLSDTIRDFELPHMGINPEDAVDFAYSTSQMVTTSYGVAIVMPAEGKTDAVKEGLQKFIDGQIQAQTNYLPEQLEIAEAATVTVAPTGEVILVCAKDGADILAKIEAALAQ